MKYGKSILNPIQWAMLLGNIPDDIAGQIRTSMAFFKENTELFDSQNLQGPTKQAELIVKLGYWLAMGQLSEKEFRIWAGCIPEEDNAGWDVDLLNSEPESHFRHILKMGPLASRPEACLIQETTWDIPVL